MKPGGAAMLAACSCPGSSKCVCRDLRGNRTATLPPVGSSYMGWIMRRIFPSLRGFMEFSDPRFRGFDQNVGFAQGERVGRPLGSQ